MIVKFKFDRGLYRRELINEKRRLEATLNATTVHQVEVTVRLWCKQFERVLFGNVILAL